MILIVTTKKKIELKKVEALNYKNVVPDNYKSYRILSNPDAHLVKNKKCGERSFAKRPAEELYDLRSDSAQVVNVADQPKYADTKQKLKNQLENWMKQTADPWANNKEALFDSYSYYGKEERNKETDKKGKSP